MGKVDSPTLLMLALKCQHVLLNERISFKHHRKHQQRWRRASRVVLLLHLAISRTTCKHLDQIFFCDPVVIESICYRMRTDRLINEGNTTGGLGKNWTERTYQVHACSIIPTRRCNGTISSPLYIDTIRIRCIGLVRARTTTAKTKDSR